MRVECLVSVGGAVRTCVRRMRKRARFAAGERADRHVSGLRASRPAWCEGLESRTLLAHIAFAVAGSYPLTKYDGPVAVADLNKDGKADLVVGNPDSLLSVLRGNGDGTFQARTDYPTGGSAQGVAIGDLDADGNLDLVTANAEPHSTLSVLRGRGDGTFLANVDYSVAEGPRGVAIGDLNNDGKADLVAYSSDVGMISVLLGNGDGTYKAKVDYGARNPSATAIGDVNADGKADLVIANYGASALYEPAALSVLLGKGDGSFQPRVEYAADDWTHLVALGDFNADGKVDLVTDGGSKVSVRLGNGDGTFQAGIGCASAGYPTAIAVSDLNADGRADLVTTTWTTPSGGNGTTVNVFESNGDGTFQPHMDYEVGVTPDTVAIGDFNGDGKPDLAATVSLSSTVSILLNTTVHAAPTIGSLSDSPDPVTVGSTITLTAGNVTDTDGTIANVKFYRESNGIAGFQATGATPDTLVGTDTSSAGGWTTTVSTTGMAAGAYAYYARATDNWGGLSSPVSTTNTINQPPTVGSLAGSPNPVTIGSTLTLRRRQ